MTKNELKSTTHGGGRVLSVILAGTLALGMTPAVSLTSQTLEPVQAFAASNWTVSATTSTQSPVYSGNPYTVTIAVTDGDNGDAAVTSGWSASVTGPDNKSVAVTDATFQATAAGTYSITVTEDSDSSKHTASFVIDKAEVSASATGSAEVSDPASLTDTDKADIASKVQVKFGNTALTQTTDDVEGDYTVSVANANNGTSECTVTLTNPNYTFANNKSSTTVEVTVTKAQAGPVNLATSFPTFTYTDGDGKATTLSNEGFVITVPATSDWQTQQAAYEDVAVAVAGEALTKGTNYDIAVALTLGQTTSGTLTITGIEDGGYKGTFTVPFTVEYEFGDKFVSLAGGQNPSLPYNNKAQAPEVTVTNPATGDPLKATDYTVSYQQIGEDGKATDIAGTPTNAGSYNVVVTYNGQKGIQGFSIAAQSLNNAKVTVAEIKPATYTGQEIAVPDLTITAAYGTKTQPNNQTLKEDVDYTVAVSNGEGAVKAIKDAGDYTLTITAVEGGNYVDSITETFTVNQASLAGVQVVLTNADKLVLGNGVSQVTPEFDVTFNGVKLATPADYTLNPANLTTSGDKVLVTLQAARDSKNFTGSKEVTVKVLQSIADATVVGSEVATPHKLPGTQIWGEGSWQKPAFKLQIGGAELTEGVDYTVAYGENNAAGDDAGTITVTGIGQYGGTLDLVYNIEGVEATIENVKVSDKAVYNGAVQDPADFVTFDLVAEDEEGNPVVIDPKDYKATIKTNYEFKDAKTYGLEIVIAAGQYEADPYTEKTITIAPANLNDLNLKATADQFLMTKDEEGVVQNAVPEFVVTLNGAQVALNTPADYTFGTPTEGGLGKVGPYEGTITGAGNYTGTVDVAFTVATDINNFYVAPIADVTYNGKAFEPVIKVLDAEPTEDAPNPSELPATADDGNKITTNYTVEYKNNVNAGTAQIVITGQGAYGGTKTVDFTINKAAATLDFEAPVATYTGSAVKPEPVVTLKSDVADLTSGKDFTATYGYANNIDAGTATITVNASGAATNNYTFEAVTKDWTITAADIDDAAYTGETTVEVGKQPKVALTFNGKTLVAGTDYDVTATPNVSKEGKATLTVTGKGNFQGTKTIEITVGKTPVTPDKPTSTQGWKQNSTGWWYDNGDNSYPTSTWKKINGNWYYFNKSGYALTGWQKINGTWYYLNKKGEGTECAMVSNCWKKINGAWYSFDKNGAMRTGWYKENGIWYYLNKAGEGTEGKMVANQWKQINGSWFFFHSGGAMATNQYVGPYWVDANGYWVR